MSELLNATLYSSAKMLRYYDRTDTLKKSSILNTQIRENCGQKTFQKTPKWISAASLQDISKTL